MKKKLLDEFLNDGECSKYLIDFSNETFSERMLREHLDQNSEFASRRLDEIDRQVNFLFDRYLQPGSRVLDLACGPGLYTSKLAEKGVECSGYDIAPAAIRYAKKHASPLEKYSIVDLNAFEIKGEFNLILMLFGIANNLKDLDRLLNRLKSNIHSEGKLVLELMDINFMKALVDGDGTWTYMREGGLLSDKPYYQLCRRIWNSNENKLIDRNLIIENDARMQVFEGLFWGYSLEDIDLLLEKNGYNHAKVVCKNLEKGDLTQHFFMIETSLITRGTE